MALTPFNWIKFSGVIFMVCFRSLLLEKYPRETILASELFSNSLAQQLISNPDIDVWGLWWFGWELIEPIALILPFSEWPDGFRALHPVCFICLGQVRVSPYGHQVL